MQWFSSLLAGGSELFEEEVLFPLDKQINPKPLHECSLMKMNITESSAESDRVKGEERDKETVRQTQKTALIWENTELN